MEHQLHFNLYKRKVRNFNCQRIQNRVLGCVNRRLKTRLRLKLTRLLGKDYQQRANCFNHKSRLSSINIKSSQTTHHLSHKSTRIGTYTMLNKLFLTRISSATMFKASQKLSHINHTNSLLIYNHATRNSLEVTILVITVSH